MDFNYLYHRHQVSLFMSDNAACAQSRAVHRELTRGYAAQITTALRERRPEVAA
jgi:hypothetical protein